MASLADELADSLPANTPFNFYHLSTPPTQCSAIYSPQPAKSPEKTYCESHLLAVSITAPPDSASAAPDELLVFAIECLIYTTRRLSTIFVSKADSTGFLRLLAVGKEHPSPLRTISSVFVGFLVKHRIRPGIKLVVDLFARASDQYLFPGSVENESKHVSDDRQLVKWWCRVLDPLLAPYAAAESPKLHFSAEGQTGAAEDAEKRRTTAQAYLLVPGEDSHLPFLPPAVRYDPALRARWKMGHPLRDLASRPNLPSRCLIPHFPDDPKGRFLLELDDELPDAAAGQGPMESPSKRGNGEWKSVRSLEQFWETMAFRSECSSGRLVGFIWLVFTPPALEDDVDVDESTATIPAAAPGTDPTANHSQTSTSSLASLSITLQPTTITAAPPRSPTRRRAPLTGPIIPRLPRIKSTSSTTHPHNLPPPSSRHYSWPSTSRGTLVLADKEYEKATEMLLRLDFAARGAAAASTRTWVDEVGVLAGGSSSAGDAGRGGGMEEAVSWSRRVVGRNTAAAVAAGSVVSGENSIANGDGHDDGARTALAAPAVNVLGVKRKADEERTLPSSLPSGGGTANVLGAGLVRKKPKRVQPVAVVGGGGI